MKANCTNSNTIKLLKEPMTEWYKDLCTNKR